MLLVTILHPLFFVFTVFGTVTPYNNFSAPPPPVTITADTTHYPTAEVSTLYLLQLSVKCPEQLLLCQESFVVTN